MPLSYRRIVVKIGSNVLTQDNGLPDLARMEQLVGQIVQLKAQGREVVVVSSGAVAAGRSLITLPAPADAVRSRQLLAAVGQVKLLSTYAELLGRARPALRPGAGDEGGFPRPPALPQHAQLLSGTASAGSHSHCE